MTTRNYNTDIPEELMTPDDLTRRTIERRAVEAAIWSVPAGPMVGIRKSLAGIGADLNQVAYFSQPLEARHTHRRRLWLWSLSMAFIGVYSSAPEPLRDAHASPEDGWP